MIHYYLLKLKYFFNFKIYIFIKCIICGIPNKNLICKYCNHIIFIKKINNNYKINQYIDYIAPSLKYENPTKDILHLLKYHKQKKLAWYLGFLLNNLLIEIPYTFDYIIPVPSSKINYKKRGFDPIKEILQYIIINNPQLKIRNNIIINKNNRTSQVKCKNKYLRAINIKGSFTCNKRLVNKKILIIDDVITTGSTVNEIAIILKQSGAIWVGVCTLMK